MAAKNKAGGISEAEKSRKLFEDQVATLKRSYERDYNEMVTSFSQEHEEMNEMLTGTIAECIELKNKNVDLNTKFEAYFEKSTEHIKKQEKAIEELSKEV